MAAIAINPRTKVGEVLDAFPALEEILLALSPAFAALKNPILRRTVARVATLEQAAGMAGISPQHLVAALRQAVGQTVPVDDAGDTAAAPVGPPPLWISEGQVQETIDAEALLAAGQQPLAAAIRSVRNLAPGALLRVISSFPPVPLVEAMSGGHYEAFTVKEDTRRFATYVRRRPASAG